MPVFLVYLNLSSYVQRKRGERKSNGSYSIPLGPKDVIINFGKRPHRISQSLLKSLTSLHHHPPPLKCFEMDEGEWTGGGGSMGKVRKKLHMSRDSMGYNNKIFILHIVRVQQLFPSSHGRKTMGYMFFFKWG